MYSFTWSVHLCVLIGLLIFYCLWSWKVEMEIVCTYNIETKENWKIAKFFQDAKLYWQLD